jgi:hypothetical protein
MFPQTGIKSASKEGRMAFAVNSYNTGRLTSIRGSANLYDVAESTLRTRLKGRPSRQEYWSVNHKLTAIEEQILVD